MKLQLAYAMICLSPMPLQYQIRTKDYKSIKNHNLTKGGKFRSKKEWEV